MRHPWMKLFIIFALVICWAGLAYAEATSKDDIEFFLEDIGTFLINKIGPGLFVIGIAITGASIIMGNHQGMYQGAMVIFGGGLIMLARAILDLLQGWAGF